MRWTVRVGVVLFLAWLAFAISPYLALYRLARAVEARDVAAVTERVSLRAVRLSLARQIVNAYLEAEGKGMDPGLKRQVTAGAGVSVADPILAELLTPDALLALLSNGTPTGDGEALAPSGGLSVKALGNAWSVFLNAQTRGFQLFEVALPPESPPGERLTVQLRLMAGTWRLVGVELPGQLKRRLVERLPDEIG